MYEGLKIEAAEHDPSAILDLICNIWLVSGQVRHQISEKLR